MLRRSLLSRYQVGAHVPPTEAFQGARIKNWPRQKIPSNLEFLPEQRWSMQPIQRDVGKVPRNFVLKMLYFEQPAAVESLWKKCVQDPECVLDSRRHLREVLKQCRDENYIYFEKEYDTGSSSGQNLLEGGGSGSSAATGSSNSGGDNNNNNSDNNKNSVHKWMCYLSRERYSEVKNLVDMLPDAAGSAMSAGMRGDAADNTHASAELFRELGISDSEKLRHLEQLRTQTEKAGKMLNEFQRVEMDFVPYTDLNGKVKQMWFYETTDLTTKPKEEEEEEAEEENGDNDEPEITIESSDKK